MSALGDPLMDSTLRIAEFQLDVLRTAGGLGMTDTETTYALAELLQRIVARPLQRERGIQS